MVHIGCHLHDVAACPLKCAQHDRERHLVHREARRIQCDADAGTTTLSDELERLAERLSALEGGGNRPGLGTRSGVAPSSRRAAVRSDVEEPKVTPGQVEEEAAVEEPVGLFARCLRRHRAGVARGAVQELLRVLRGARGAHGV